MGVIEDPPASTEAFYADGYYGRQSSEDLGYIDYAFTAEQKLMDARSLEEALSWLTPVERVEVAGDARLLNQLSLLPDALRESVTQI